MAVISRNWLRTTRFTYPAYKVFVVFTNTVNTQKHVDSCHVKVSLTLHSAVSGVGHHVPQQFQKGGEAGEASPRSLDGQTPD